MKEVSMIKIVLVDDLISLEAWLNIEMEHPKGMLEGKKAISLITSAGFDIVYVGNGS